MKQIVIMPGGFHPFHAGHYALYKSALEAFPQADVYVAATNDQSERPFPFSIKEKLAKLAGVAPGRFVQVKSPFQAKEITQHYDPNSDVLIFVRSEKDKTEQPKPGGTKKDGSPAYFQPWTGKNLQPFSKHAYIAYLPTVTFGPGIQSATEIRKAWPTLDDRRKTAMVMSLYPATQKNPKLAQNVVQLLDMGMGGQVSEGQIYSTGGGAGQAMRWYRPKDNLGLGEGWEEEKTNIDQVEKFTQFAREKLENTKTDLLDAMADHLSDIERKYFYKGVPTKHVYTPIVSKLLSRIKSDRTDDQIYNPRGTRVKPEELPDTPNRVNMPFGSIVGPEAYWSREVSQWGGEAGREIARDLINAGYVENLKEFLYMVSLVKTMPEFKELPDGIQVGTLDEYLYYAKELRDQGLIGDKQYLNSRFNDEKLERALAAQQVNEEVDWEDEEFLPKRTYQNIVKSVFAKTYPDVKPVVYGDDEGDGSFEIITSDEDSGFQLMLGVGKQEGQIVMFVERAYAGKYKGVIGQIIGLLLAGAKKRWGNPPEGIHLVPNDDLSNGYWTKLAQQLGIQYSPNAVRGERPIEEQQEQDMFMHDPESEKIMHYAQQHYPGALNKQQAFVKFVQRALKHSEEEDISQDEKIDQLIKAVKQLDDKLKSLKVTEDYIDEQ